MTSISTSKASNIVVEELAKLLEGSDLLIESVSTVSTHVNLSDTASEQIVGLRHFESYSLADFPTGMKIKSLIVGGIEDDSIKAWSRVLTFLLDNIVAEGMYSNDDIDKLDGSDLDTGWISTKKETMLSPKPIKGTDFYVNVHGSSYSVYRRILKILEVSNLDFNNVMLKIETKQ